MNHDIELSKKGEAYALRHLYPGGCPQGIEPRVWRDAVSERVDAHLAVVTSLLALLDDMDDDPDLEDNADHEPSLSGAERRGEVDLELDLADYEPMLGAPEAATQLVGWRDVDRLVQHAEPLTSQAGWARGYSAMDEETAEAEDAGGGNVIDEPHDGDLDLWEGEASEDMEPSLGSPEIHTGGQYLYADEQGNPSVFYVQASQERWANGTPGAQRHGGRVGQRGRRGGRSMKRRALLAALPALPLAVPAAAAAPHDEHPWDRARRLARELSDTLAIIRDTDSELAGGMCVAVVHPGGKPYATAFADIDSYDEGWRIAREFIRDRPDPLAAAMADYRRGIEKCNAMTAEDEARLAGVGGLVDATFGPALSKLASWDAPARTASTALDALTLAANEDIEFLSDMSRTMFSAACGYLLQIAARQDRLRS